VLEVTFYSSMVDFDGYDGGLFISFSGRGGEHYELYEKADWKDTMELRTMIESNTADGEICYWKRGL
jgi:hypothetical protein